MNFRERESGRIAMVWLDRSGRLMEALQAVNRAGDLVKKPPNPLDSDDEPLVAS